MILIIITFYSVKILISFILFYSSAVLSAEDRGQKAAVLENNISSNNDSLSDELTTINSQLNSSDQPEVLKEIQSLNQSEHDPSDKRSLIKNDHFNRSKIYQQPLLKSTSSPHFKTPSVPSPVYSSLAPTMQPSTQPPMYPSTAPTKPPSDDKNNKIKPPPTYRLQSGHDSYKMSPKSYSPLSRGGALLGYKYQYQGNLLYSKILSNYPIPEYSRCPRTYHTPPKFRASDVIAAFNDAERGLKAYSEMEKEHFKRGNFLNFSTVSTASRHLVHDVVRRELGENLKERDARRMEYVTKYLAEK
jgi:hypothetical protein